MDEIIEDLTPQEIPEEIIKEDPEDLSVLNPIQNRYAFWYRYDSGKGNTNYANYNQSIKKIASFQSVERFWTIYDFLKRPADFKDVKAVEFHLFKDGISPFWEDSQNKAGGKWMMRLRKGVAARYWEDILLAIIGEQFDVGAEICGAVLSIRGNEDIISIWNKTAENTEAVNKIRDQIRRIVRLPDIIPLEYKVHKDSLNDKSSYRNPNMVFRANPKPSGDRYGGGYRGGDRTGDQPGGFHHRAAGGGGWKGTNSSSRWNGNNNNEDGESAQREPRRERTDGGAPHHRERGDNDGQQHPGWRRARSDGEGTENNNSNNRYGEYRSNNNSNGGGNVDRQNNNNFRDRSATTNVHSSGQNAPTKPPTQSSTYSSGGGSFASRLKGNTEGAPAPTVPAADSDSQLKSPTGENWTKVKNPFSKA